ncbi:probable LRR receptor-like serine/threonine-protein kinase At2g16250 [Rhodamnia argentea]|uniref:non-specific serine/threonine protein kinase n=1 Tax=Rhodamnia argentea TaxID=178133 RepID=A0A8B8MSS8_9MYRT|nr:probable LRR receptor-like serine/threonine-protein kinase At2g16250 [Rhodamnia argentea]
MKAKQVLVLAALVLFLIQCAAAQRITLNSSIEWSALRRLRSSLGLRARDWPIKADPCRNWTGVECRDGQVTAISVSGLERTRLGRMNPRFAVDALADLTLLETFNASGFLLPGSIPERFGYGLPGLRGLDLRSCAVNGAIPSSLGRLSRLTYLYLSDNSLTGNIASSLGQLNELSVLDLSRNFLTGSIPASFSLMSNLSTLDISSNFISGTVPVGLGSISSLQVLNLSDNSLTASIPGELGNLSQLVELDLSKNSFSGSLPVELGGLRSLKGMRIGGNGLEGQLPEGFFSGLAQLEVVVLRENKLDGRIPSEVWSLPRLHLIDISANNFTGELPYIGLNGNVTRAIFNFSENMLYGNLNSSIRFFNLTDLSGNYLQGKVSDDSRRNATLDRNCLQVLPDQRSLADCRLFYSERGLQFDDFGGAGRNRRWVYILIGVFGGLALIVVMVVILVLLLRKCNKGIPDQTGIAGKGPAPHGDGQMVPKEPSELSGLGDVFSFQQLAYVTSDFSESNLIKHGHSGDLYHGILENGTIVVIKRVDLRSFDRESYIRELEIFGKISHTRFVPLLGHCFEHENEKLFVYKYMPNRDLASSFYRATDLEDESPQSLDWITRLKIAIGAAEALSYLHHECNPPLVHRDIQVGSILLDDKFEVRVGSLSEVRAQDGDPHGNVITRLLRKPQTSEQGLSGSSSANCAHDVFCFGKVLLELVTGKLGISKSDDATTREWLEHTLSCISVHDKELVTKIMDPSLIVDEDLLEEVWAMAIVARSCLNPRPSKRPLMRYVLKALENPLKVVREDSSSSGRLRTASSRKSWHVAFFGSLRHSSSDSNAIPMRINSNGFKQSGRVGSHSSGGNDFSSSHKRLSSEIFPEPIAIMDMERLDGH